MPSAEGKRPESWRNLAEEVWGCLQWSELSGVENISEYCRLSRREAAEDSGEEKRTRSMRTRPLERSRRQRRLAHVRALSHLNSSCASRQEPNDRKYCNDERANLNNTKANTIHII
ncbi:hypothetical protein NDU88_004617 [Pleurodeles waltl]|uniref:Uncharacterized protein n=1 Tax=Pleurodeles waltl TaxID=8319 RepID=A0AAV7LKG3_PLEWA|nr:hypothetical protein NDU88_004617 [Pleurodeles waltl]